NQVKLRGFRIELGEIENILRQHCTVRDAVVVAREIPSGDKRLIAYLVSNDGNTFSVSELKQILGKHLPEFMVPSSFAWLDSLPLTPNGKVDRRALPLPVDDDLASDHTQVLPRNEIEQKIAAIWQEA